MVTHGNGKEVVLTWRLCMMVEGTYVKLKIRERNRNKVLEERKIHKQTEIKYVVSSIDRKLEKEMMPLRE